MLRLSVQSGFAALLLARARSVALAVGVLSVACGGGVSPASGGNPAPGNPASSGDPAPNNPAPSGDPTLDGNSGDGEVLLPGPGTTPSDTVVEPGCGCASSATLQVLSCTPNDGVRSQRADSLMATPSGDVAVFSQCFSRAEDPYSTDCQVLRWSEAGGPELLVQRGYPLGIADDGSVLVVSQEDETRPSELLLIGLDGSRTRVPLGPNAQLSAGGRYVVDFVPQPVFPVGPGELAPTTPLSRNPLARWSRDAGLEVLAELPDDDLVEGGVFDVAADGSVIVGSAYDGSDGNFRQLTLLWTAEQGLRRLETSPTEETPLLGFVSRDGTALAGLGSSSTSEELAESKYWTPAGGFQSVAPVNPRVPTVSSWWHVLSADGRALSGTGWVPELGQTRVFRWTEEGLSWLGPEDAPSSVVDMTPDGALVLGSITGTELGFVASPGETRRFDDLLVRAGVDATGWELKAPRSISADGRIVFGEALCGGVPAFYRWLLPD